VYVTRLKCKNRGKKESVYETVLLRESYREGGKVKTRTIANITHSSPEEIAAIELALKNKHCLAALTTEDDIELKQKLSLGASHGILEIAKRLGISKALGNDFNAQLALIQIVSRTISQGSRLSAVRFAQNDSVCDLLELKRGFDEGNLYDNLKWLSDNQTSIEKKLFNQRKSNCSKLFLYDVTSSYFEGKHNQYAMFGYNRDGKKSKRQLVAGLLCDDNGDPISIQAFDGNTQDPKTLEVQIEKVVKDFRCKEVVFVGDRGMIKTPQQKILAENNFKYITALTFPQIKTLLNDDIIQMSLFDNELQEVQLKDGTRYIMRRNPVREREIQVTRKEKLATIEKLIADRNTYLREHPKATVAAAEKKVIEKLNRLKMSAWASVSRQAREFSLVIDDEKLKEESKLDGCYVITTDVSDTDYNKEQVHDRYKDLQRVEKAFRTSKTGLLEMRPIHVRTKASTDGHLLVVMLSYLIVKEIEKCLVKSNINLTVEEAINELNKICSHEVKIKDLSILRIPTPNLIGQTILDALNIKLPETLIHRDLPVVSRKELKKQA
jgi:transposase